MGIAEIIALALSGAKVIQALMAAANTLQRGGDLTEEQMAIIRSEQAAAQARNDVAIDNAIARGNV